MNKKHAILIVSVSLAVLIVLFFFSAFGVYKVDIYSQGENTLLVRKIKNENTLLSFIKPSAENLLKNGDLVIHKNPIVFDTKFNKKKNYCSRIIGMPGDIITIRESKVFINDKAMDESFNIWYYYRVSAENKTNFKELLGNYDVEIIEIINASKACNIVATQEEADKIAQNKSILNIRKIVEDPTKANIEMFSSKGNGPIWNKDNLGPVAVPQKDVTVMLSPKNIGVYKWLIEAHEANTLIFDINKIVINNNIVTEYTIKQNYFFVLNDNRYNREDSRQWGFIPENQIIGKVIN